MSLKIDKTGIMIHIVNRTAGGFCPDDWHYYNGNCYFVSTVQRWNSGANRQCQKLNANLTSISDYAEMDFVHNISWELSIHTIIVNMFLVMKLNWNLHALLGNILCCNNYVKRLHSQVIPARSEFNSEKGSPKWNVGRTPSKSCTRVITATSRHVAR